MAESPARLNVRVGLLVNSTLLEVPRRSFKRVVNRGLLGAVPVY